MDSAVLRTAAVAVVFSSGFVRVEHCLAAPYAAQIVESNSAAGQDSVNADDTLPGHKFDRIFEEGFDCTRILTPATNLVSYIATLPTGYNIVCLKPGTYVLSSRLVIPSNTVIQGMAQGPNRSSTLFLAAGVDTEAIAIIGKQDISLRHLKLDGNGVNQANNSNLVGISIAQSHAISISDLEIAHTSKMGIAASQVAYLDIHGSLIDTMDEADSPAAVGAIWISNNSQFAWIGDNYIIGRNNGPGGDGGIDCYGTDEITIYRNTLADTGKSSIYTGSPGCTNMSIWGNDIHNSNEFAVDITLGANHVYVGGNLIDRTALAAMVFWQADNVTVEYNSMLNGHAFPPSVPCKSIVVDTVPSISINNTNHVDSGPLYCFR